MATQPPHGVGQAITAIWISLAVSALSALAGKLMGLSTQGECITRASTVNWSCQT